MERLEKIIERILWESRFMVILAVISSVFSALILILMGTYDIIQMINDFFLSISDKESYELFQKKVIVRIISAVDFYLIATVLLIFGVGLYELFISKIDYAEKDTRSSRILIVHSLNQLKDKLAKVIVMVLIVTYFKYALSKKYEEIMGLLYLSAGIIMIALAIFFLGKSEEEKEQI